VGGNDLGFAARSDDFAGRNLRAILDPP